MPVRKHRVAILALPSVVPFDLGVPVQIFAYPRADLGARRYDTVVCGERAGPVPTSGGFSIVVSHGLEALSRAQTIVIPGIDEQAKPISARVIRALRAGHARGARLVSTCTGAFVLAAAGLLDHKRATTHWLDTAELAERYPHVSVDPNVLYVDQGRILTSAGIAAGLDLCLHVVRLDFGAAVANAVARRLVVPPHRSGGQVQFIPQPVAPPSGDTLEATRAWVVKHLARPLTVAQMAEHAKLSPRTFARHFLAESGTSPMQWLLRQRVLAAQQLLEQTSLSVDVVSTRCGFGSPVTLRLHFRNELGVSPAQYRRTFRANAA